MGNNGIDEEVIVHPADGMQLSEGWIHKDGSRSFVGDLPGIAHYVGSTVEEVLKLLERKAKAYYGDDVIVELAPHSAPT